MGVLERIFDTPEELTSSDFFSARKLHKIAKDDLYVGQILSSAKNARPETIVYHIQQAIEKSIKAVFIHREMAVPLTHDLDYLTGVLPEKLTQALPPGIGELSQYATIKRYTDGDELIEKKDIQELIKLAEFYLNWSEKILED